LPRRRLLGAAVLGAGSIVTPASFAWAAGQSSISGRGATPGSGPGLALWPGPRDPRQIWLRRKETGEQAVLRYFDGQRIDERQYFAACSLLRDVRAGIVATIDFELLDLIFAVQRWFVSHGIDLPAVVHSGYRSPATNATLEGAAKNSLHMFGKAIDVSFPGVPADYIGRLAAIFGAGGVGFYADRGFVHLDTGAIRYWRR
jgi:uncharacterized protein YcbK (DUF882 family)